MSETFPRGGANPFSAIRLSMCLDPHLNLGRCWRTVKNSEYDREIPQSQTADNPLASRGIATHPSRDTRKTN